MDSFDVFIMLLVYCLVVHLHHDHLVTSVINYIILTNTPKQHIFNFLAEINIFNKLNNICMSRYCIVMLKVL